MVHLTIARPSAFRDDHIGNRIRFSNSFGVMARLRAERGVLSRDANQRYDPSPWSPSQPQVQTAIEPTTSQSERCPRDGHPSRWQPCSALSPREWLQLAATS
jgi:hypothetical protein